MNSFIEVQEHLVLLTEERRLHIESDHPEMGGQIIKIENTLKSPDIVIQSKTDVSVRLYHRRYKRTPVTEKYLCVVVKIANHDWFIITAYFTDTIKRGEVLWKKK